MGSGSSVEISEKASELQKAVEAERQKPVDGTDIDTPRGVSAKEEVKRLRELLHHHAQREEILTKENAEMKKALMGNIPSLKTFFKTVFERSDVDGNGCLSKDEFFAMINEMKLDITPEEISKLEELTDADSNGSITLEEFAEKAPAYFKILGDMSKEVHVWMQFVDPESGQAYYYNKLTEATQWDVPAEYVKAVDAIAAGKERKMPPDLKEYITTVFKAADRDGSGELNHDEFWNLIKHELKLHLSEEKFMLLQERSDVDQDGSVRWKEFVLVAPDLIQQIHDNVDENDCWIEQHDEEGTIYYVNTKLGTSQWEKPDALQTKDDCSENEPAEPEPVATDEEEAPPSEE